MTKHKIGDVIKTQYAKPITGRYIIGQLVDVFNNETDKRVATFEVIREDGVNVVGQVTNTYGHKRFRR